jgi:hypothetical protein
MFKKNNSSHKKTNLYLICRILFVSPTIYLVYVCCRASNTAIMLIPTQISAMPVNGCGRLVARNTVVKLSNGLSQIIE